jgi:hypothetical protein
LTQKLVHLIQWLDHNRAACCQVHGLARDAARTPALAGSRIGDAAPLISYSKRLVAKRIGQSTTYPGIDNVLTVTLIANAVLLQADASELTISGLTGTQTGSSGRSTTVLQSGADVAAEDTAFALSVPQAAGIAVGTFVQIDDEIVLVNGEDTTANQRYLVLQDPTGFAINDYIQVEDEIVRVTSLDTASNSTLSVERGLGLTTQAMHPPGVSAKRRVMTELQQIAQSHHTWIHLRNAASVAVVQGYILIGSEVMRVLQVSGSSVKVERGRALTVAVQHPSASIVTEYAATTINQAGGLPSNTETIEESWATLTVASAKRARIGRLALLQVCPLSLPNKGNTCLS